VKFKPPYLFDAAEFRPRIADAVAARNLSVRAAADEIRCDHTNLWRICIGRNKPNVELYLRIEAWLTKHEPSRERATTVRRDK
jgi:hypothetical protein